MSKRLLIGMLLINISAVGLGIILAVPGEQLLLAVLFGFISGLGVQQCLLSQIEARK